MISDVIVALTAVPFGEQIRRADALADLIQDGEVLAVYDGDNFIALVDRYLTKHRPMLAPGES
jgi:hypothetical protein